MKLLPDNKTKYALTKQQIAKENKRALNIIGAGLTALPVFKGISLLNKVYKNRPVTLYRGVPNLGKESLSHVKKRVKINNINDKNRFLNSKGNLKKTYGSWFTTEKREAKGYAGDKGSLFKVKVDLKTLDKVKKEQPKDLWKNWVNKNSREFYGIVPSSIRRKAKKL